MELTTMKNIGTEMEKKLNSIGVDTAENLTQLGSKNAFIQLKMIYPEVCLVHLYTLQGAIDNIDFNMLSSETKAELKEFNESLK